MQPATLAILAGGASSRMGTPKAALTLNGQPILRHLLTRFAWPCPTLLITAPGREHPPAFADFTREAVDPTPDQGPLRGLLTALESSTTDLLLVTTVDMPGLLPANLQWLLNQFAQHPAAHGLLLRRAGRGGGVEPFPSVYRRSAIDPIRDRLAKNQRSVHGLLDHPGFLSVDAPSTWPAETWTNLNYPVDLEAMTKIPTTMTPAEHRTRIIKYQSAALEESLDTLAVEEPLEIRLANRAITITMRTPGHDDELAAGFLLSEGILTHRSDLVSLLPCPRAGEGNVLDVTPAPTLTFDFARLTRHVFASSSCGLCGKATLSSILQHFPPVTSNTTISPATLLTLPHTLRASQATFARTGGLHAAALFSPAGDLLVLREDVGRHNAVDKVIGHAFLNSIPLHDHLLLVSGRSSFEIMQKALAARLPIVAAISAPSSLAVQFAEESNQTLVGFLRDDRFNVYSHPRRIS